LTGNMASCLLDDVVVPALQCLHYSPLRSASNIRLLTIRDLCSLDTAEAIHVTIEEHLLENVPTYNTLSYRWGESERPEKIVAGDRKYISVTRNLLAALNHLRRKGQHFRRKDPVPVWIDAICINQDDIQERGSQVHLIRQIYQQASKVIVWLHTLAPITPRTQGSWTVARKSNEQYYLSSPRVDDQHGLVELPLFGLQMFRHPWFMRIWMLQEIVYAQVINLMRSSGDDRDGGLLSLSWEEVVEWVEEYFDRELSDPRNTVVEEELELSMAMMLVMHQWRGRSRNRAPIKPLSELFSRTKLSGASEPKDKVFALLALASDVNIDTFQPDYTLPWKGLCVKLTLHTTKQSNTLDIFRSIGLCHKAQPRLFFAILGP